METKFFSLEEIALNDGKIKESVWVIIKDNVYDLSGYLEEHPGGGDLITEWAGKDGTKAFQDFGHSSDAKKDLTQFKIGELREEDRKAKKSKKVEAVSVEEKENRRSFCSYLTCGLCG